MADWLRLSRGAPRKPTMQQEQMWVRLIDRTPRYQQAIETVLGLPWDQMNHNQKVQAIDDYIEMSVAPGAMNMATRHYAEFVSLAFEMRDSLTQDDMIVKLTKENEMLRTQHAKELEELREYRRRAADEEARRVQALHSDEEHPGKPPRRTR